MKYYVLAVSLGLTACQKPPENKSTTFGKNAIRNANALPKAPSPVPAPGVPAPAPAPAPGAPAPAPAPVAVNPSPSPAAPTPAPAPANPTPAPAPAPAPSPKAPEGKSLIVGRWEGCANVADAGLEGDYMPVTSLYKVEFKEDGTVDSEYRYFKASNCMTPYDDATAKQAAAAYLEGIPADQRELQREAIEDSYRIFAQVSKESNTYKAEAGEAGKVLKLDIDMDQYLSYKIDGDSLLMSDACSAEDVEFDPESCPAVRGTSEATRSMNVTDFLKLRRVK